MTLGIDRDRYERLTPSERTVIDYLSHHQDRALEASISVLARETATSTSTVSRAIQKVGLGSIAELRVALRADQARRFRETQGHQSGEGHMSDAISKLSLISSQTLDDFNLPDILRAANAIKTARRVLMFARGETIYIAQEFMVYLQYLGYNVTLVTDHNWMLKVGSMAREGDLVIILSVQCRDRTLPKVARLAHEAGVPVIGCCCRRGSDLERYASVMLFGHTEEIISYLGDVNYSRLPLMMITQTIISYLGS